MRSEDATPVTPRKRMRTEEATSQKNPSPKLLQSIRATRSNTVIQIPTTSQKSPSQKTPNQIILSPIPLQRVRATRSNTVIEIPTTIPAKPEKKLPPKPKKTMAEQIEEDRLLDKELSDDLDGTIKLMNEIGLSEILVQIAADCAKMRRNENDTDSEKTLSNHNEDDSQFLYDNQPICEDGFQNDYIQSKESTMNDVHIEDETTKIETLTQQLQKSQNQVADLNSLMKTTRKERKKMDIKSSSCKTN